MKRIITFILAIMLVAVGLVGCNSSDDDGDGKSSRENVLIETANYQITEAMASYVYKDICYSSMEQYGFDSFIADYEEVTEYLEEVVLLCEAAKEAGIELSEDHLVDIEVQLRIRMEKCDAAGKTLEDAYGNGVTKDVIREIMTLERLAEFARADKKLELNETLINDDKAVKDYSARKDSDMYDAKYIYFDASPDDLAQLAYAKTERDFKLAATEIVIRNKLPHDIEQAGGRSSDLNEACYSAAVAVMADYCFRIATDGLTLDFTDASSGELGAIKRQITKAAVKAALEFFGESRDTAFVETLTNALLFINEINVAEVELDYDEDVNPSGDVELFTWLYDGSMKDNKMFVTNGSRACFITEGPKYCEYITKRVSYVWFDGENASDDAASFYRMLQSSGSFEETAMSHGYQGIGTDLTVLPGDLPTECIEWLYGYDPGVGIVDTQNGSYVLYFLGDGPVAWWVAAYRGLVDKSLDEWEDGLDEKYEIKTDETALNNLYSGLND